MLDKRVLQLTKLPPKHFCCLEDNSFVLSETAMKYTNKNC
jgi:hypothetical protein